ncbi:DUF4097 family beta strand repeat-containing protein [Blautia sp. MSJ-36]|uniref:DUF4097 family beta strand repeat-containing protein n=1 Tax=Blautia sp. MSJ-36 TaxID=2841530 RepID=UPI001C0FEE32|nr:DUF4097 family beta strand repeat-containing protein [Blautia sp. MSJ-36]MBU5447122.1 DUF2807 domain-containing protein [Blautia sp. MSJ-36]
MKRFLKVILILAAVFGAAGLGLTAGGAAMGATMGDIGVLDQGVKQLLNVLDGRESVIAPEEDMAELEDDFQADAENAVNEKGVLTDNADSSAYTKVYEASAVSDLSCDLRYEELVLKTWNEDKVQVKVTGKDHNRVKINNDNGSLTIASSQKVRNRSIEIFCPKNLNFQKIKLQMGAGTIQLDGDFKADQMEVNVGAGTLENSGSLDVKEADFTVGVGTADISELQVEKLNGSCGMGNMDLTLAGKAADYNYELKCGLGNLEVDDSQETSITSGNKQITNEGATKNIKLDCGMGNVQVDFDED